jgi:hypothetical protein
VGLERGPLSLTSTSDRLCGLVVRVRDYRSGGPGFDSRALQEKKKKKVVGLKQGPFSLVSVTEELLGRNSTVYDLESRGIRHADHVATSSRRKLALISLTNGGRSVGIVRLRTEAMECFLFYVYVNMWSCTCTAHATHWWGSDLSTQELIYADKQILFRKC